MILYLLVHHACQLLMLGIIVLYQSVHHACQLPMLGIMILYQSVHRTFQLLMLGIIILCQSVHYACQLLMLGIIILYQSVHCTCQLLMLGIIILYQSVHYMSSIGVGHHDPLSISPSYMLQDRIADWAARQWRVWSTARGGTRCGVRLWHPIRHHTEFFCSQVEGDVGWWRGIRSACLWGILLLRV